jgi:four helix bundle protein
MHDFRKLDVWAKAHQLALDVHREAHDFPDSEQACLGASIRSSAVAVVSRIAESCGMDSNAARARHIQGAVAEAARLDALLLLACDLAFLPMKDYEPLAAEVGAVKRMLVAFAAHLRTRQPPSPRSVAGPPRNGAAAGPPQGDPAATSTGTPS